MDDATEGFSSSSYTVYVMTLEQTLPVSVSDPDVQFSSEVVKNKNKNKIKPLVILGGKKRIKVRASTVNPPPSGLLSTAAPLDWECKCATETVTLNTCCLSEAAALRSESWNRANKGTSAEADHHKTQACCKRGFCINVRYLKMSK